MTDLLKRLHIWVGLFNFTILLVFAAAGLHVTLAPAPSKRQAPPATERTVPYTPPKDASDHAIAADVYAQLGLPLTVKVPDWAVARNDANVLVLQFHTPNGLHNVTVDEAAGQLQIVSTRNTMGEFLNLMHATTLYEAGTDIRKILWAAYVDLSILCLLFMVGTGIWLWLASRPRLWFGWASFSAGTALFVGLWIVTR